MAICEFCESARVNCKLIIGITTYRLFVESPGYNGKLPTRKHSDNIFLLVLLEKFWLKCNIMLVFTCRVTK